MKERQTKIEEKKDIFDRIMELPVLEKLNPIYKANKEILLYLFFGVCTTVVGIIFFQIPSMLLSLKDAVIFGMTIDMNTQVSNVISWVCAVTFAYITNRVWVFKDKAYGTSGIVRECVSFYAGRLVTLVIENVLLNVCTVTVGMKELVAKIIVSVVTIVLNYVISKLFVFKKKK